MSAAHVSVYVREDAALVEHLHVSPTGEPCAWLYVGEDQDVAVWGSPAALRRLAAAVVAAAEHAEALLAPRHMAGRLDGCGVGASSSDPADMRARAVAGS